MVWCNYRKIKTLYKEHILTLALSFFLSFGISRFTSLHTKSICLHIRDCFGTVSQLKLSGVECMEGKDEKVLGVWCL